MSFGLYMYNLFRILILFTTSFDLFVSHYQVIGAKGDWDFQISDLVKNPDETDI